MDEITYFSGRARHYAKLAGEVSDDRLKDALYSIARHFSIRAVTADPNREVRVIDGVTQE